MNPIIPILILICVIAIGYFIFNQYNLAHSEGSSCTPSSGDTVTGGSAYEYDTKGGCAPSGCTVGYTYDKSACTVWETGKCTKPDGAEHVPKDAVFSFHNGICTPDKCSSGYVVDTSDGTCVSNTCKPESDDPNAAKGATYEYDSDDDCAPSKCKTNYKVTGGTCQKSTTGASV